MVRNDIRFKAHFSGALLKLSKFFYDVLTRSYNRTAGSRKKANRDLIDARIGVVNQAGGDVTTDIKVRKLIGDVMAQVLLSLY